MRKTLSDIVTKLQNGAYHNEEHVRLSLVARLLQELDWNIWDPAEVFTEFVPVPNEDTTRVDLALFITPHVPSVFIEVKAVGKLRGRIQEVERQVRDYNRNNTALFSVITDGRQWMFYYSQTAGEFSQKCFEKFDLQSNKLEDIEQSLIRFLSRSEIANNNAKLEAEKCLQLNQKQRAMRESMLEARRMVDEPPYPSLPSALVQLVEHKGFTLTQEEAVEFIRTPRESSQRQNEPVGSPSPPVTHRVAPTPGRRIILNPDNPDNLFHTKLNEAHFNGTAVRKWKELIHCAMRMAYENKVPMPVLRGNGNVTQENPNNSSFSNIEGTDLWLQGMDANQCWKRSYALARRLGVSLKVEFTWRATDRAAHPGSDGVIEWSPNQ